MRLKKVFIGLGALLEILFMCSCSNHALPDKTGEQVFCIPDSLLQNITFDTIRSQSVVSELALSGKITFNEDRVAKIFPLVSGHVSDVKVTLGDYVEKGTVLAIIRSSDMANYFNDYKSSQSELAIAKKNLEVTGNMQSSGVSSEKDYLVAQNEYQKSLAQFNKIKEVLKINGSTISINDSSGSSYIIKAPISGYIVEKNLNIGMDLRSDANDNLFTISDLNEVWATASVFETDISKIQVGSSAEISTISYPDKIFLGKVSRISNILDPETKVMNVKIHLENKDYKLKPGMFANIRIRLEEHKKMFSLKSNAIIFDEGKSYVLRYRGKCKVTVQQVAVYKSLNDLNYIECDSLKEGDITIAQNGLFIFTALRNL
jgi:membrane fusion protein, heavy metal efflux system